VYSVVAMIFGKTENYRNNSYVMKKIMLALALTSAFLLLAACGADATPTPTNFPPPTPTPPPTATTTAPDTPTEQASAICGQGSQPAYITDVVLAKDTQGANFTPVEITDAYEPAQATFHAVVTLQDAPQNLKLGATWYLVRAAGYQSNSKIDEKTLNVEQGGSRNVDFTLKTTQATWPPGTYCVEIYADGELALSKTFTVVGGATTPNASSEIVQEIVLAEDTNPDTFEPINPTNTFKKNAPAIHAAIKIENAPPNTSFGAKWYPPDQQPLEFNLPPVDGTRWLDFRLTPGSDGFPVGEYRVEIYLNEKLVDTKTFTVE
jgi:hypothetical protein